MQNIGRLRGRRVKQRKRWGPSDEYLGALIPDRRVLGARPSVVRADARAGHASPSRRVALDLRRAVACGGLPALHRRARAGGRRLLPERGAGARAAMARLGAAVPGRRAGGGRVGASAGPARDGGGAWSYDGRRAAQCGGAQCVSPRQDRRVAAEDRRVAARGSDGGAVSAGAARRRPTSGCSGAGAVGSLSSSGVSARARRTCALGCLRVIGEWL